MAFLTIAPFCTWLSVLRSFPSIYWHITVNIISSCTNCKLFVRYKKMACLTIAPFHLILFKVKSFYLLTDYNQGNMFCLYVLDSIASLIFPQISLPPYWTGSLCRIRRTVSQVVVRLSWRVGLSSWPWAQNRPGSRSTPARVSTRSLCFTRCAPSTRAPTGCCTIFTTACPFL